MNNSEFSWRFDVAYNNITSNQAPGLNEAEKSNFLTQAEYEITKNHYTANSAGNTLKEGFDDSAKRQADFSTLMKVAACTPASASAKIDSRSSVYSFPTDVFIMVNETIQTTGGKILQVMPLRYDEYTRLMSKPFKRPLKYQAWRLLNSGSVNGASATKVAEIITNLGDTIGSYTVRYVRKPKPIILEDLDGLTIEGIGTATECELDPILHEDILQRAVELAKIAWTATGQDNVQLEMTSGQRSE